MTMLKFNYTEEIYSVGKNILIHLRCRACKLHLAGALSGKKDWHNPEFGLFEYVEVSQVEFDLGKLTEFSYQSPEDLIIHPQWYANWKQEWEEDAIGAAIRQMSISTKDSGYGCCGPIGKITCRCGKEIGNVFADCYASHWMLLFEKKIERSDQVDGEWTIHADGENKNEWLEVTGKIVNGQREGEWEIWRNEILPVLVKTRNKAREEVILRKEEFERELIRIEIWHQGNFIENTDIS